MAIVGGGPAGTATGHYLAKQGLNVAILERTAYENWRVGETLPPHAQIELARLGVWPRFLSQKFVSSLELRWSWAAAALVEHNFLLNPYGPVWHVDRQKFDLMLLGQARASGADIAVRAVVRSVRQDSGRWRLAIFHAGKETTLHCSFLVDATGQGAFVARALGTKRLRFDNLIGAVGICRLARAPEPLLVVEAVENGWWYSVPLSPQRLLVGFISDGDIASEPGCDASVWWSRELAGSVHTAKRVGTLKLEDDIQRRPALTSLLEKTSGHAWLAVGDAASSYDPLSGAGVSKALHFAPIAASAIVSALGQSPAVLSSYDAAIKRDFSTYLKQRLAQYTKEQRWPASPFWQRRHTGPAEMAELPRHTALAHVECETPL